MIVTGAASGIGLSTAHAFASDGWQVVCVDRDAGGLAAAAAAVGGEAVCGNVASDATARAAAEAANRIGRLAAVCNIAGINPPDAGVLAVTDEVWDEVMAVNVRAIVHAARYAVPAMIDGGAIVNMASVHAFAAMTATAPYAASKGAVVALTRQLALDLAPRGIRVVAIAPGSVDTPMSAAAVAHDGLSLEELGFPRDRRALGRVAEPDEIAAAIVWLAGEHASFVNGTTLVADGGLLARLPTLAAGERSR